MPNLFTTHDGHVFEMPSPACDRHNSISDILPLTLDANDTTPSTLPPNLDGTCLPARHGLTAQCNLPRDSSDEASRSPSTRSTWDLSIPKRPVPSRHISCGSSSPLIEIVDQDDLPKRPMMQRSPKSPKHPTNRRAQRSSTARVASGMMTVSMVYNEYGELVDEKDLLIPPTTDQLSVTKLLRVIKKAYHHELRDKLTKIIVTTNEGKPSILVDDSILKDRLSSWNFGDRSPKPMNVETPPPITVYFGPPRALEIGCSDGSWCFKFKAEQPSWIVEGTDDTDHWSCIERNVTIRDFMKDRTKADPENYFSVVSSSQQGPDFTMRNLNCLLAHESPIPHNLYEFIRAREIFDRIESYKTFLVDLRSLLKPDGVVEFLEFDPRPRCFAGRLERRKSIDRKSSHTSGPQTDWTDNIADRFKNPLDEELATTVPGWAGRVAERLKANLRPQDGVAAAKLKSWLQGAGFWDVKQIVLPVPVGGSTISGQLLKEFVMYQIQLENYIPKLCEEMPKVETCAIESGAYFMNLHIVTGRKPHDPRPGDLLRDSSRQEMTASKYDAMARHHDSKSSQWKRYDLHGKLTTMMQNLTTFTGVPPFKPNTQVEGGIHLLGRHPNVESPFHAPPFVSVPPVPNSRRSSLKKSVTINTKAMSQSE